MKQYWQKSVLKIDALTLRERIIIFAMVAILLIAIVNVLFLDPLFTRQKQLSEQLKTEQLLVNQIQTEIRQAVMVQKDPDAANRERLKTLTQELSQMQTVLLDMQKGLVSPDKMTLLLEDILKRNGKLRLLSLKTLSSSNLLEPVAPEIKAGAEKNVVLTAATTKNVSENAPLAGAVYKHGVEIVVQGGYLDMVNYMAQLEAMPWQLFWGKAKLNVDDYPKATLTLTLFTLSLDKKWLNL
jgi:MSHA biogenesis protein MshJ